MTVIVYKGVRGIWTDTGKIKTDNGTYPDRISFKCNIDRLLEKKRDPRYDALATSIQRAEKLLNKTI